MKRSVFALALVVSFSAQAQDQYSLDTIEVTDVRGNKDQRTFLETSESVSVLKPKSLNRGDLNNSVQMLNGLSNVQTQSDKNGDTFSIRGISDMGVTGYQKDNLASILVDDVFQSTLAVRAGSFENWDLESIEVYRGAQSTTQGVNSLAGNILLYHTKPVFHDEGAAKLAAGNYGRKEGAFVFNKNLIDNKLAMRVSYNKELSDGFIKNGGTKNDNWNNRNKDHFVTDFLYKMNAKDELRLNLKLLRMNRGGSYVQEPYKKYKTYEDQDFKNITNNKQAGLTYTKEITERVSNKLIIGATQGDGIQTSDGDGTINNTAGVRNESVKDQFMSIENQFKYKSDKIKNVLGAHLHRYTLDEFYDFTLLYDISPGVVVSPRVTQKNTRVRNTYALFESFNYDFTKHHSINLGARLEVVKNEFGSAITAENTAIPAVNTILQQSAGRHSSDRTNTVILPKVGYTYKNGDYSLGAFFTQGYRTGGLSVNRQRGTVVNYDPEKTNNYELSYKLVKSRFVFTTNVFYTKWNDQQVELKLPLGPYDTQVDNAAKSELYGAEVEGSYEFANDDSVRLNLGHVHTQFLSFKNNNQTYTGNAFPDAATFTAQASYWKVLAENWKGVLVGRFVGKSYSDPENIRKSPEQFYTDFNTQYTYGSYVAEFFVRNIFDQHYRVYNGKPRTTQASYQVSYHRMSAPREFGARLNYYW